jgi:hypothetical protein
LAKSSPVAPCVTTDILPNVAVVKKLSVTAFAELVLATFTEPKLVLVDGLTEVTVKLCVIGGAAA